MIADADDSEPSCACAKQGLPGRLPQHPVGRECTLANRSTLRSLFPVGHWRLGSPSMVRKVIEYRGVSTARNAVSHIRRASPAKVDPVEREEGSLLSYHVGAKIGRSWSND
ncbi:hypothetical protein [Bradyrhizobium elkanii]|uniref:hypothetical protein n=1 Tax=Bradyrhizobium elkanii TaxID=29448 RepID=UPI003515DEEA